MNASSYRETDEPPVTYWLDRIREAVRTTDYGSIYIKIHDGQVVEIETSTKTRFHPSASTQRHRNFPTTHVEASHKTDKPIPAVYSADRTNE